MQKPADFPVTVSVLTPAYQAQAVLARAVASVQAQTCTDWEMIVVDDGSDDGTLAVARSLALAEPRLRVIHSRKGQGAAGARNTALAAAQGRYIAFLDADDAWMPDKLAQQLAQMQAQGAGLGYTGFTRIAAGQERPVRVPAQVTRAQLLRGNVICCSSAVYDRAVVGSPPMPDLEMRQDYALWLELLAQVPYATGVTAPLVRLHTTPGSLSSNKWRAMAATWAMHRHHFGTSPLRAAFYVAAHTQGRLRRG